MQGGCMYKSHFHKKDEANEYFPHTKKFTDGEDA